MTGSEIAVLIVLVNGAALLAGVLVDAVFRPRRVSWAPRFPEPVPFARRVAVLEPAPIGRHRAEP